jgi:hypothetical protein
MIWSCQNSFIYQSKATENDLVRKAKLEKSLYFLSILLDVYGGIQWTLLIQFHSTLISFLPSPSPSNSSSTEDIHCDNEVTFILKNKSQREKFSENNKRRSRYWLPYYFQE